MARSVTIGRRGSPAASASIKGRTFAEVFFRLLLRNKLALFGSVFLLVLTVAVFAEPWLGLPSSTRINLIRVFQPSSPEHLLGTDDLGRDVLARLLQGGRISLLVALAAAALTVLIGSVLGVMAGYLGGWVDATIMRFTDGVLAVPTFFLLLTVVAFWGSSPVVLVLALSLTRWMGPARLIRSEVLRTRSLDYVVAAQGLGAGNLRVMLRHLLPQAVPSLIVATSIGIGDVMLIEAGISYLGLGIQPPLPSWGNMLSKSQVYMWSAPLLAVYPGVLILLSVLSFNTLGDVLRDALDPRRRSGA
jgi:peptide/nickel transport system permease protein